MISSSPIQNIKRSQRESFLFRHFSELFGQLTADTNDFEGLYINRVSLSSDKGVCVILFYTAKGEEDFRARLGNLICYKPSFRKALAHAQNGRFTPEVVFEFDATFEKQQRIEHLLDSVKYDTQNYEAAVAALQNGHNNTALDATANQDMLGSLDEFEFENKFINNISDNPLSCGEEQQSV